MAQALQPGREDVPTIILLVVASLMMFYGKPFRLLPIASWFGNEATLGWFAVYLRASATPVLLLAATRLFVREWQLVRERQRATRTQTA